MDACSGLSFRLYGYDALCALIVGSSGYSRYAFSYSCNFTVIDIDYSARLHRPSDLFIGGVVGQDGCRNRLFAANLERDFGFVKGDTRYVYRVIARYYQRSAQRSAYESCHCQQFIFHMTSLSCGDVAIVYFY